MIDKTNHYRIKFPSFFDQERFQAKQTKEAGTCFQHEDGYVYVCSTWTMYRMCRQPGVRDIKAISQAQFERKANQGVQLF